MPNINNITEIPSSRVPFIDEKTKLISREWYRYLNNRTIILSRYTVETLPQGVQGEIVYVTDALSPAYNTTVVGGGSSVVQVFFDGTSWKT